MSDQININNSWTNLYRNGVAIIISGFIAAIVLLLAGWYGWGNYFSDKPEMWFQRSGSMVTALLLVSDYYVYKLANDVGEMDMIPQHAVKTKDAYRPFVKILPYMAIFLTVLGTFVWGYGDILYSLAKQP